MEKNFLSLIRSILLITLFPLIFGCSAETDGEDSRSINISGQWKIIEKDAPGNESIRLEDSNFPDIVIPGNWLDILKKNKDLSAKVWIRKKIFISSRYRFRQSMLFIERIGIADETYFNGVRIGASGIMPENPDDLDYQISWNIPRQYFIPDSLIKYDAENVIAVRIYSHIQSGVMGDVLIRDYHSSYSRQVFKGYRPLFVSISAVILNIMLTFIFILLYISERKKTEYLYFTLIIACTLLCSSLTFTLPFMIDGLLRYKFGAALYCLTNFFVFLGIREFLGYKNRYVVIAAVSLLAAAEAAAFVAPDSRSLVFFNTFGCMAFIDLCILASAGLFIHAAIKDPRRYWYFLIIVVPITISVMRNSYYIFSYRFNELPMTIFMHVPLVFMFITLYHIYEFEKSGKEKDLLYSALLKKSNNYMRLLQSFKEKNRKPEPRELITNVIEYLDANYTEKYDRIELSKKFGLNEDYMGQIFKKATGTNISSYINTNRINAARELLVETSAKIIDIAYHVGFDNLTHFHRQFKAQTGCTPNEYRALVAKKI